ncbi:DHHC-type zinc finger family protein [Perilla frutescens var. frutescens]|nr:DHHC-type zinc finger family protein [Perilla frutescens var. frutescens]
MLNSVIFTVLASLCVFSFLVCVLADPGGVPSGYVPDVEENGAPDQGIKRNGVILRICDKCSTYKPPRAHHCRACRRCVLRMDHHCSWINNCVGQTNYKPFLLLVFYAAAATTYSAIIIISCIMKDWDAASSPISKAFRIGIGSWITALSLTLWSLLIWNMYLASHNMTSIEYHEGKRAAWVARKSGLSYHHPYDVGFYKNATLVLGPDMLKWLWPAAISHIKDGLSFPTTRDSS